MKYKDKFNAFENGGGKISSHKVPRWRASNHDVQEYLDFLDDDLQVPVQQVNPA